MLEYLAVLLIGFWLGVAIFLYVSCFWLEEILDLPKPSATHTHSRHSAGASGAHAQLKRLVARVVEEAAALPALARYAAEPHTPTESSYEDLLATAILNKVIERYQTESGSGGRSSGIHSASASPSPSEESPPRSLHSRNTREISPITHRVEEDVSDWEEGEATDDAVELPRRVPFPEYGGDIVHENDNLDRDFDEVSGSDIQAIDGSWEENWLFQKKKIKNIQSVPVPMLVPNSNTEYRALIGDRDADDTTDLSDNASETDEQEVEYKSDMQKVLDSKHVIGGKLKVEELDFEPDSLMLVDGNDEFEKIYKEYSNSQDTVDAVDPDAVIKNIVNGNDQNGDHTHDSILIVGVDSGPIEKTEFNLKEEIHRTVFNGDHSQEITADSLETDTVNYKESPNMNTLSRHEREGEYEETVTVPVQRYADSLRRKHFEDEPIAKPLTNGTDDELIPGSVAYRERKKWLNYVEMPNNPYSPEAIQKRLSTKSASSLFDTITSKNSFDDKFASNEDVAKKVEKKVNDTAMSQSTECLRMNGRSPSPSPRILKDVLAEEVPQYKRYGRDYYIKEAKLSSGGREKSFSDTSSVGSVSKSGSLDAFDSEFASPVSASSSLSELEAGALRHSLARALLRPRHASPNFAVNPIFEHPPEPAAPARHPTPVRPTGRSNGSVENEDIVRLRIPKPEITEDTFESYDKVRRSSTLRSKRRPALDFTFGGSLRLSKGFHKDLW